MYMYSTSIDLSSIQGPGDGGTEAAGGWSAFRREEASGGLLERPVWCGLLGPGGPVHTRAVVDLVLFYGVCMLSATRVGLFFFV